jgi:hypothetical protein
MFGQIFGDAAVLAGVDRGRFDSDEALVGELLRISGPI